MKNKLAVVKYFLAAFDPEFLESIALRATRATLAEGGRVAVSTRLITR